MKNTLLAAIVTLAVACGGQIDEAASERAERTEITEITPALPYGYCARLAYCDALAACGDAATDCAGDIDDAPTMTARNYERCAKLVTELDCGAPHDRGPWISTKFACGL